MILLKEKIKEWLGPLWWYTFILFCVQRLGDVINIVVGLWLVPKYVPRAELGAVLPLVQVGSVLGLPLAILLVPFGKFLNVYAAQGELGKVKSLLRDVFVLAVAMGIGITFGARYLMPLVFERMRVQKGMLTWLIVLAGVTSTLTPLFSQALQGLKKFRQLSILGVLSAPVRLIVLLLTLPIRGLSGYFAGQLASDLFGIVYSFTSLRTLFSRKIVSLPYWCHWKEITWYALPVAVLMTAGRMQSAAEFFVIRHRLPDLESAAYYFITRFAEIPVCLWTAISIVFFPLISERHEKGAKVSSLFRQSMLFILLGGGLLAMILHVLAPYVFSSVSAWSQYAPYASLMGVASATCVVRAAFSCFVAYEMACRRFGFVLYTSFFYVFEAAVLYGVSGIAYFDYWLPSKIIARIQDLNLLRLNVVVWTIFWFTILLLGVSLTRIIKFHQSGLLPKSIEKKGLKSHVS